MIRRLTLSQRLTLVFTAILLFCAAAACGIQIYSSNQYGNVMVQRLSAGLAQQIVISEPLLDNTGQVNRQTLKILFDRLMTLNPSVELYLISPDGQLLADAAPSGHLKRRRVNIAPLQKFLAGSAWPVYGDDPRSTDKQKVFSVAPIHLNGELRGYLYIILQGEELNALADTLWQKALWNALLWSLLLVAVFGLLAGMLVWYWVTRPVKQLTANVSRIEQDSMSAIKQLAMQESDPQPGNEVAVLRNTFIELARKVASQWDQLSDNDRQRREFIANISHDLRTPLTSLLGYLETLSMKADTLSPEDCRHSLAIALRQGHKVRHLSQQLFELARLEHGGIKPHLERFAIGELIQDVAQKFDLTIETRQLQLRLDIPHTLPLINADVSMIERVVTNLVDNAVRHTPQGGTIRLKVWQEHDLLQVEVADSGPGVEENMRAQLFQRPSALSQKASRETQGGLGLLIVRRMLELHGGGIHLMDATPGACFRFFVPL
ncbi:two-component sensor histidine kinase [Escherichia coli]|nr:two-component sensor histidine kinase [Escherichia coli]EGF1722379.1 HAMP domain-containing histidine kinase [Escherichia coli]